MGILLLILKVIGIILLSIIGLFLLIVLLILFCPFTYNISAEGNLNEFSVIAKFGWLACLIRPIISYKDNEVCVRVRIFGIPINLSKTEVKKKKDDKSFSVPPSVLTEDDLQKVKDKMEAEKEEAEKAEAKKAEAEVEKNEAEKTESEEVLVENKIDNTDTLQYNEKVVTESEETDDLTDEEFERELLDLAPFNENDVINVKPKKNPIETLKSKFSKSKAKAKKTPLTKEEKEKIKLQKQEEAKKKREETKAKINDLVNKIKEVKDTLENQKTKDAIALLKSILIKCIKHIAPNRFKGHVEFGMEDPYVTGQILAAAAILYPAFNGNLGIVPYFEADKTFVEGKANIKGHVYLIFFVAQAIKVLRNKTIMGFIKKARK